MEDFSLRPASSEDLPAVLAIEKQCYPMPWTREAFELEIQKPFSNFLVLTDDETDQVVAGYIVYWILFDECHVLNIAVNPEWRGLGAGQRLMRQAVADALKKEMKRIFLEVRKSNDAAVHLYQKLGFFIDHVKKAFYEDGEDAYFMVLYLNKSNNI